MTLVILVVLEILPHLFVLNSVKFWAFFAISGPFWAIFRVVVSFKYLFGTYLCRQSTLVLEVQPYLFVKLREELLGVGLSVSLSAGLSVGLSVCLSVCLCKI